MVGTCRRVARPRRLDAAQIRARRRDGPAAFDVGSGAAARHRAGMARSSVCGIFRATRPRPRWPAHVDDPRITRMNAPDADAPLIERVKRGDVKAFEMLVVKYQR